MPVSHVVNFASPRKLPIFSTSARHTSCAMSSASLRDPVSCHLHERRPSTMTSFSCDGARGLAAARTIDADASDDSFDHASATSWRLRRGMNRRHLRLRPAFCLAPATQGTMRSPNHGHGGFCTSRRAGLQSDGSRERIAAASAAASCACPSAFHAVQSMKLSNPPLLGYSTEMGCERRDF